MSRDAGCRAIAARVPISGSFLGIGGIPRWSPAQPRARSRSKCSASTPFIESPGREFDTTQINEPCRSSLKTASNGKHQLGVVAVCACVYRLFKPPELSAVAPLPRLKQLALERLAFAEATCCRLLGPTGSIAEGCA